MTQTRRTREALPTQTRSAPPQHPTQPKRLTPPTALTPFPTVKMPLPGPPRSSVARTDSHAGWRTQFMKTSVHTPFHLSFHLLPNAQTIPIPTSFHVTLPPFHIIFPRSQPTRPHPSPQNSRFKPWLTPTVPFHSCICPPSDPPLRHPNKTDGRSACLAI